MCFSLASYKRCSGVEVGVEESRFFCCDTRPEEKIGAPSGFCANLGQLLKRELKCTIFPRPFEVSSGEVCRGIRIDWGIIQAPREQRKPGFRAHVSLMGALFGTTGSQTHLCY